jgi:hypothetical protein
MIKNIFIVLAIFGVGCFLYDYYWLNAQVHSLMAQNYSLIELGLFEEATQYRNEAGELGKWITPVAVLAFFLIAPLTCYLIVKRKQKHAQE